MLGLIFTLAVAASAPADGTYAYVATVAGQSAQTTITVKRNGGSLDLNETDSGTYQGQTIGGQATLTLDDALAPTAYSATYDRGGKVLHTALTFSGNTATQTGDAGATTYDRASGEEHFVVLDGALFAGFFALPSQMRAWNGATVSAIAPMFGHGAPVTPDAALKPVRPAGVPPADSVLAVSMPIAFTIWYDPASMLVDRMDVPTEGASVIRRP